MATVEPGIVHRGYARKRMERSLEEALTLDVPVVLLLPDGMNAAEILGAAEVPLWPFRRMDRAIVSELLALTWPQSDAAALRSLLPSDDQLAATPMLPLMLSLRSNSVEEAAKVLRNSSWKPTPRTFKDEVKASRTPRRRRRSGSRTAFASPT